MVRTRLRPGAGASAIREAVTDLFEDHKADTPFLKLFFFFSFLLFREDDMNLLLSLAELLL